MREFIIQENESGQTLEKYIRKLLPNAPLSIIYKLFRRKDVRVNGVKSDGKVIVKQGDNIAVYLNDNQFDDFMKESGFVANDKIKPWIIYEDKNLLIINKPRGVLVQADGKENDKSLDVLVVEYLMFKGEYDPINERGFKPGPAHRIDRNTSGIVIFGKNHDALVELSNIIKDHEQIEKHYISLVCGEIEEDGEVNVPLRKNFSQQKVVVAPIKDGAKEAITKYHVLERLNGFTLLDLVLLTGRTHQIRVHMSYIRHHVVGDTKYGNYQINNEFARKYKFNNQFLHAAEIHFKNLNQPLKYLSNLTFKAEMPEEYKDLLSKLKQEE